MHYQFLFSAHFIYPYVWLALIACAGVWLVVRALRPPRDTYRVVAMALPAVALAVLTGPLWFEGLLHEIQCRDAGLRLGPPVRDAEATVHWESFSPDPGLYSLGVLTTATPTGQAVMTELVRAVAEGRLQSFDIPYEPKRKGVPDQERLYQRFYLAPADGSMGECVRERRRGMQFAPGTCLAFVQSQGIQASYELKGSALQSAHGRTVQVLNRASGRVLGEHTFVEPEVGETGLVRLGLRKLRPWSCTPDARRRDLAEGLVHMVFGSASAPPVMQGALAEYRKRPWAPVPAPDLGPPIPRGRAGIDYWIAKGAVRPLGPGEIELWQRATGQQQWRRVPEGSYLITGDMELPQGLTGAHSVSWLLPRGQRIPPGPRGHSTFYEVDRGCVWSPSGCER